MRLSKEKILLLKSRKNLLAVLEEEYRKGSISEKTYVKLKELIKVDETILKQN
jgi:uncharacterized membrane protein